MRVFVYSIFLHKGLFATGVKPWLLFARMHTLPLASLRHGVLCCTFQACFKLVTQHINIKLPLELELALLAELSCS